MPPLGLRRIATNGIQATVAVAGSGPAVLLLHGFPLTWQWWAELIGPLAEHHRVITPELRGLGASTRAAQGYDAGTPTASSTPSANPPPPATLTKLSSP